MHRNLPIHFATFSQDNAGEMAPFLKHLLYTVTFSKLLHLLQTAIFTQLFYLPFPALPESNDVPPNAYKETFRDY